MDEKENITHIIYHQGCLYYNSRPECKNCDGFGKNLDKKINTLECYTTKEQMEDYLGVKKFSFNNINNP